MSEKQKNHLSRIRKIALDNKKKRRELKRRAKAEVEEEIKRKEAELQSKQKEKQEMKKVTNVPIPQKQQPPPQTNGMSFGKLYMSRYNEYTFPAGLHNLSRSHLLHCVYRTLGPIHGLSV